MKKLRITFNTIDFQNKIRVRHAELVVANSEGSNITSLHQKLQNAIELGKSESLMNIKHLAEA